MSDVVKRALGVEIVLLNSSFAVVMSDDEVLTSLSYCIRFPPTVKRVRYCSVLCGL